MARLLRCSLSASTSTHSLSLCLTLKRTTKDLPGWNACHVSSPDQCPRAQCLLPDPIPRLTRRRRLCRRTTCNPVPSCVARRRKICHTVEHPAGIAAAVAEIWASVGRSANLPSTPSARTILPVAVTRRHSLRKENHRTPVIRTTLQRSTRRVTRLYTKMLRATYSQWSRSTWEKRLWNVQTLKWKKASVLCTTRARTTTTGLHLRKMIPSTTLPTG